MDTDLHLDMRMTFHYQEQEEQWRMNLWTIRELGNAAMVAQLGVRVVNETAWKVVHTQESDPTDQYLQR